ncbi:MAG: hypothetical protein KME15_08000 [Drouetiella hepatica Uher 2000/2452]|uniref:Uncharacterized protein n=1 Tax=Drouetiella hepatica Uher 2000/2452 TaxID=904376 RepID=A0A951Q8A7_9CYAN|nr:hypothetical protein [Drouetiella hepatica Uher 2000/2452]
MTLGVSCLQGDRCTSKLGVFCLQGGYCGSELKTCCLEGDRSLLSLNLATFWVSDRKLNDLFHRQFDRSNSHVRFTPNASSCLLSCKLEAGAAPPPPIQKS